MAKAIKIPLYIIKIQEDGYHVFLEAKINVTKIFLLLDTGASRTVFDIETLKKIHAGIQLEENEVKATGLGSDQVQNFVVTIRSIEIGALTIHDFETGALDLAHVNKSYSKINIPDIGGVCGSDILMAYHAVISFKDKTLTLYL